ncbi:MAG: hypothetical protein A2556_00560 [Candidatus Vogelbacteria bacterium RIFOXYD2_FULL_44_9]|uniref:YdbS-like PH domain-containing protein n=1 Tax=Candidatus Vogelbacteria bacterium RIFOXYD2_FULL_44_9 TaxID=1802441 RepID=A0A1G2QPJ5_9BACT|nr:MAG: hypothetical protein A2556_00560 [Candidatus Vogelbacteria bacterium RIFOXYD2_FULL_44_9]
MIQNDVTNKLPQKALWYFVTYATIFSLILAVTGFFCFWLGPVAGTKEINGVVSPATFNFSIVGVVLIFIAILIWIYSWLSYYCYSFILRESTIVINWGVIFKNSHTIDFNRIQNIDLTRGPVMMLFGLSSVAIWTSSPEQLHVSQNGSVSIPDGKLYLAVEEAEWLRNHMATVGDVQKVKMV